MFQNYLTLAWRNLRKNRQYTLLNVLGLSLGLVVTVLLLLLVRNELSFDNFHANLDRIHRVNLTFTFDNNQQKLANAPNIVAPTAKEAISGVEEAARLLKHNFGEKAFVRYEDRKLVEQNLYWGDGGLFRVFTFDWLQGDPATVLEGPNRVVLSRSTAKKYFGTADPMGKVLEVDGSLSLEVTGVYEDLPINSTLDADLIGSFSSIEWASKNLTWSNASFETWLLLRPGADPAAVDRQLTALLDKNVPKEDQYFTMWLQPLGDVHLHSADVRQYTTRLGDPQQVRLLGILALIVFVIACINYMNLATAQAQQRMKEVGVSKVLGAGRRHLIYRFLTETGLLVGFSILFGLGLLVLALPAFNRLTEKAFTLANVFTPSTLGTILVIGLIMVAVAGAYPAWLLSGFRPQRLLQRSHQQTSGGGLLRRVLVVAQFAASVVLIAGSYLVYQQLQYIQQKKLGYEPEQVVAVSTAAAREVETIQALINGVRGLSDVVEAARAQTFPGQGGSGRSLIRPDQPDQPLSVTTNRAGGEIVDVLGLKLLAGRSLPLNKADGDTTVQVVLNKLCTDFLGYTPEEAIGKRAENLFQQPTEIVGVVEDFHSESLRQPISGYVFHNASTEGRPFLLVKLRTQDLPDAMRRIEAVYDRALPDAAFDYTFLDQHLDQQYRAEQRTAAAVLFFSILAIFIACLGLYGLAAFTAARRVKEIGIRKVLGASTVGITALLSREFLWLVLIGIAISVPLAWWVMRGWLEDFAYRTDIHWSVFVVAGLVATVVALATVSLRGLRAALADPVESLRSE